MSISQLSQEPLEQAVFFKFISFQGFGKLAILRKRSQTTGARRDTWASSHRLGNTLLLKNLQRCVSSRGTGTWFRYTSVYRKKFFSIIGLLQDAENSSVLYSRFLLFIYLICGNVYLLILNSQIMPPSPCPFDNHNLFSISESVYFIKQT